MKDFKIGVSRELLRNIIVPSGSSMSQQEYKDFLGNVYDLMSRSSQYFTPDEGINSLELAHFIPEVNETVIAIYVGINDAVCNKGLVSPFLIRHGHNNVFVFDSQIFSGDKDVPSGTIDAKAVLKGFEPPNETWDSSWTYVMIMGLKRKQVLTEELKNDEKTISLECD